MRTSPALAFLLAVSMVAIAARAQTTGRSNPPLVIASVEGRDVFEFYCAPCHGRDGRGGGPVAPALKVAPPDLTLIARRHGGAYPGAWVDAFVAHDVAAATPAHGTREMPVWGPVFRGLDPSDALASARVANIVRYIESLQAR